MSEGTVAETPVEETAAAPAQQVVFTTLKEAVSTPGVIDDKTKVYRVTQGQGAVKRTKIVVAVSPSAAALEVIGRENVELIGLKEKHSAAMEALFEAKGMKS